MYKRQPKDFINVRETGRSIRNRRNYLAEYDRYVEETITYDQAVSYTHLKTAGIKNKSKTRGIIAFIAGLMIAGYGVWAFISRDFSTYLLLKSEFVFLDYNESKILFAIDYLALMGFCIFIAHYGSILCKHRNKERGRQHS